MSPTPTELTREQIEALSGRELDAEVALRVMRWTGQRDPNVLVQGSDDASYGWHWIPPLPRYSTDISAAFEVVEEMRRRKWHLQLANNEDNGVWWASFRYRLSNNGFLQEDSYSENAAEAISRAALLAVMGEEKA